MELEQDEKDFKLLRNDLLEIIEDFRRGLENFNSIRNELHPDAIAAHNDYLNLFRKINNTFTKLEIEMIENPLGKTFDPKIHDCISVEDIPNVEDNIVINVISAGWKQRGIVIKHSSVVVNKKYQKEA